MQIQFLWQCPRLLVPTLCVRLQKYVVNSWEWKKGIYANLEGDTQLLLEVSQVGNGDDQHDELLFALRGDNLKAIWCSVIKVQRDTEQVLTRWPGVVSTRWVLCPHCVKRGEPSPEAFPNAPLFQAYRERDVWLTSVTRTTSRHLRSSLHWKVSSWLWSHE